MWRFEVNVLESLLFIIVHSHDVSCSITTVTNDIDDAKFSNTIENAADGVHL